MYQHTTDRADNYIQYLQCSCHTTFGNTSLNKAFNMFRTKPMKIVTIFLKLVAFIISTSVWYFHYFKDAFVEYQSNAITTVSRHEKKNYSVSPSIIFCPNYAFKPSSSEKVVEEFIS